MIRDLKYALDSFDNEKTGYICFQKFGSFFNLIGVIRNIFTPKYEIETNLRGDLIIGNKERNLTSQFKVRAREEVFNKIGLPYLSIMEFITEKKSFSRNKFII